MEGRENQMGSWLCNYSAVMKMHHGSPSEAKHVKKSIPCSIRTPIPAFIYPALSDS